MKGWRIYYDTGAVFTDEDGTPYDAPRVGVQVIVQGREGDYELIFGRDHFYYDPAAGGWRTSDLFGAYDHLVRAQRQCLLFGRQMSDVEWDALYLRVRTEAGPRERRYAREVCREDGR